MSSLPFRLLFRLVLVATVAAVPVAAQEPARPDSPEAATGFRDKAAATARRHMVSASHPLAAAAGAEGAAASPSAFDQTQAKPRAQAPTIRHKRRKTGWAKKTCNPRLARARSSAAPWRPREVRAMPPLLKRPQGAWSD